jgi:hypothetical protein
LDRFGIDQAPQPVPGKPRQNACSPGRDQIGILGDLKSECLGEIIGIRRLEGIVSKRTDAPYRSGRSRTWLKSKNPASAAVRREREEEWR